MNGVVVLSVFYHVRRVGFQTPFRYFLCTCVRLRKAFHALLNDGSGRAVNDAQAMSNDDEDILRGLSKFYVYEIRIGSQVYGRAVGCPRQEIVAREASATGFGENVFTHPATATCIGANYRALRLTSRYSYDTFLRFLNVGGNGHSDRIKLLRNLVASSGRFFRYFQVVFRRRTRNDSLVSGFLHGRASVERGRYASFFSAR